MSLKTLASKPVALPAMLTDFFEPWHEWFNEKSFSKALSVPRANITESADSFKIEVAAPGLHKKDFKISMHENTLTVAAERESDKEVSDDRYTRQEYNYSSFSRSFALPESVTKEAIEATYDGGVLRLTMPRNNKGGAETARNIEVK